MRFEIKVENKGGFQKLLLLGHLRRIFGIIIPDARKIVDEIEKLHEIGVSHASVIIDSEEITMDPIFKIEKTNPVFTYKDLRLEVNVIKEVEDRLDLCQLLKNSIGMKFYMPHFGEVVCGGIIKYDRKQDAICFRTNENGMSYDWPVKANGTSLHGNSNEVCVFPSKDQRDWALFVPPWIPKEGERVWVSYDGATEWYARYFNKMKGHIYYCFMQDNKIEDSNFAWNKCVPFNEIPW